MQQARVYLSPPHMSPRERELLLAAFDSNWIAPLGPEVDRFEREFVDIVGGGHAAALSSGTAAIHLALLMLGVKPGDEVVTSTLTFAATANAITYCGAEPVFIEYEPGLEHDPELLVAVLSRGIADWMCSAHEDSAGGEESFDFAVDLVWVFLGFGVFKGSERVLLFLAIDGVSVADVRLLALALCLDDEGRCVDLGSLSPNPGKLERFGGASHRDLGEPDLISICRLVRNLKGEARLFDGDLGLPGGALEITVIDAREDLAFGHTLLGRHEHL